jgi:nucleoside-diphosphate-sugar epimerase
MRVTITGANGFIGRALARRLCEHGHTVGGVDLRADSTAGVVAGDISTDGDWQDHVTGSDLVIHTAAVVSNAVGLDEQWRINVAGTRKVVEAAVRGKATRLVHLSSVRAFSDVHFPDGVTEEHAVRLDGNPYVDTKIAGEQVVLQAHAAGQIAVTIVRPGDVYGPRSRPWTVLPVQLIKRNLFLLPARGNGIFSPVYVDDLVDGLLLAAEKPAASGQVFTLSGGVGVPCREFFGHYYRMLGKRGPLCTPTGFAVAAAAAAARTTALVGGTTEINTVSMRYFTRTGTYSIDTARRMLGYAPAVGLAEGMARTEQWLRAQRLVP